MFSSKRNDIWHTTVNDMPMVRKTKIYTHTHESGLHLSKSITLKTTQQQQTTTQNNKYMYTRNAHIKTHNETITIILNSHHVC